MATHRRQWGASAVKVRADSERTHAKEDVQLKRVVFVLGVALALCLGRAAYAAPAQGPFADVPTDHWAYDAVNELAALGIFNGYPDQTFGGKRALTRYEFAVALQRMLQDVQRRIDAIPRGPGGTPAPGVAGQRGPAGPAGPQGPAGISPEELARMRSAIETLQRLAREFSDTLATLGSDVDQLKRDLAALQARVGKVEETIAKMPKITGSATLAFIGSALDDDDFRQFSGVGPRPTDIDGRPIPLDDNILETADAIYDVDIGITAQLSDVATAKVLLNAGNYLKGYLNNSISTVTPVNSQSKSFDEVTAYYAYLDAPISFGGVGANITVGKFGHQFTPYTLRLVDVDSYLSNDKTDLGDYPILGARLNLKMGSFNIQAYGAKHEEIDYADLTSTAGMRQPPTFLLNGPLFIGNPVRSVIPAPSSSQVLDQSFGGRLSWGQFNLIGDSVVITQGGATFLEGAGSVDSDRFRRLQVMGGTLGLNLFRLVNLEAEYATSEWKNRFGQETSLSEDDDNEVWDVRWNLGLGKLLGLGGKWRDLYLRSFYKKIGVNFDAPGSWGQIGRWKNPRGIEGVGFNLSFPLLKNITLLAEYGDYNLRLADETIDDYDIKHLRAGFRFPLTSSQGVDLGYERAEYDPDFGDDTVEEYINLGWGYSFNPNMSFRLLYQIINFEGGTAIFPLQDYDASVLVTQFTVRF
jgi:hypothetical protein